MSATQPPRIILTDCTFRSDTMTFGDQDLRERCLNLATESICTGDDVQQTIERAAAYVAFIKGEKSPREAIDAALDQAGVR